VFKDSITIFQGLIEFFEGFIARKKNLKVNLGFNWKKLKYGGQIAILKSEFGQIKGLIT